MLDVLTARLRQGHRTSKYPDEPPVFPERYTGLPQVDWPLCAEGCRACTKICPTGAIDLGGAQPSLDLGKCLFCRECEQACPEGAIRFTQDYRLAARGRQDLLLRENGLRLAEALEKKTRRLFGRSLKLRQVSAGGCNACEADINVLSTVVFDLARFGIQIVASPRHADGLIITGPVTQNMRLALQKTYDATPAPKIVIAVGACAISGGPCIGQPEVLGGAGSLFPVDLHIPGCPPHPYTILDGLLRLLGKLEERQSKRSA